MEWYDAAVGEWDSVASMIHKRNWLGMVEVDNALFAIGGSSNNMAVRSVTRYDMKSGTWGKVSVFCYLFTT
jgi:hypothetical protein